MGLRSRIIIVVVIACSIINFFLCFYITGQIRSLELESLRSEIDKAAYVMRLVNTRPLYNVDVETLRVNMETFFDDENMKSISILESDIDVDIRMERTFEPGGVDIYKNFYIFHNGIKLGKMNVVYTTSLIEKKLAGFRNQMLYFTFTVILALTIILVFLIHALMRPVTRLADAASEIAAGNLDKEIQENGVGEVGILSKNFAVMRDAIKEKITDLAHTNQNLETEISQKILNEKKILHQSKVISSVNKFFQKSMLAKTARDVADLFIPIAMAVVPGPVCLVGLKKEDENNLVEILALSGETDANSILSITNKNLRVAGPWVAGIRTLVMEENQCLIANDPISHPHFCDIQDGDIPKGAFMAVPLSLGDDVKGVVVFSGKEKGYQQEDQQAAETLAVALMEALNLKKQEEKKTRLEEMMVQSEKMVSLGGLAAGMAHEINNPLAGILQNSQVIRNRLEKPLPANLKAAREIGIEFDAINSYMERRGIYPMIDSVMEAGKRAAAIVSNMLSFSRKSASGFVPENIVLLMDQTLELAASDYNLKKKFDFKKIQIVREYEQGLDLVHCRASEIQQVIFNILSNGAQAMTACEEKNPPCFTLKIFQDKKMLTMEIGDNGPGMAVDVKKRVFDPFFTTKPVGEGTGLGLAVSYFIITENHNGRIKVDSEPGKGTCFTISLPLDA